MILWVDAQFSPELAAWIRNELKIECYSLKDLKLRNAKDHEIFREAKKNKDTIIITKDKDFVRLSLAHGTPPKILWVRIGNATTEKMKHIFSSKLDECLKIFNESNFIVELRE